MDALLVIFAALAWAVVMAAVITTERNTRHYWKTHK